MALEGKHAFGSIGETRVTFVEKQASESRADFLKSLLEHNGFEVVMEEEKKKAETDPTCYTVAVTDMVFNPTTYVMERRLRTFDGRRVTPEYWLQKSEETKPQYWENVS